MAQLVHPKGVALTNRFLFAVPLVLLLCPQTPSRADLLVRAAPYVEFFHGDVSHEWLKERAGVGIDAEAYWGLAELLYLGIGVRGSELDHENAWVTGSNEESSTASGMTAQAVELGVFAGKRNHDGIRPYLGLRFGRGRVKWEYEELIGSLLRTPKDKIGYSYWGMDLGAEFWPRSFETLQWGVFLATRFNFSEFDSKTNDGFNFDFAGGDSWSIYLGGTLSLGASPSKFQLSDVEGAWLTSKDGDKLGLITNDRQNPDCILNEDGPYGSTTSETSIWNHLGKYGDDLSDFSPYSSQAVNPPQIRRDGKLVAHLTKNLRYKRRIDPDDLIHWLRTRDDD